MCIMTVGALARTMRSRLEVSVCRVVYRCGRCHRSRWVALLTVAVARVILKPRLQSLIRCTEVLGGLIVATRACLIRCGIPCCRYGLEGKSGVVAGCLAVTCLVGSIGGTISHDVGCIVATAILSTVSGGRIVTASTETGFPCCDSPTPRSPFGRTGIVPVGLGTGNTIR